MIPFISAILFMICAGFFIAKRILCYRIKWTKSAVISFDQFKSLFAMAPQKWSETNDWSLAYTEKSNDDDWDRVYIDTLFGYLKALRMINRYHINAIHMASLKKRSALAKKWQSDIDAYKKEFESEYEAHYMK